MLNLGETDREVLQATGALGCDDAGEEVLRGLTAAETQFVLDVKKTGSSHLSPAEQSRYVELTSWHRYTRVAQAVKPILRNKK